MYKERNKGRALDATVRSSAAYCSMAHQAAGLGLAELQEQGLAANGETGQAGPLWWQCMVAVPGVRQKQEQR